MTDDQNTRGEITSDRRSNARDQIVFCAFHSFLVEVQTKADYMYMWCVRNNNLDIRIAGSSCRPQQQKTLS